MFVIAAFYSDLSFNYTYLIDIFQTQVAMCGHDGEHCVTLMLKRSATSYQVKKSGSETKTKKNWKYMEILQFLDPYVQEAR